jgi:hypothetical protein
MPTRSVAGPATWETAASAKAVPSLTYGNRFFSRKAAFGTKA